MNRLRQLVLQRAWVLAVVFFLLAELLCRPFGNYPLNDDWQYARLAKRFAETGKMVVDTPVAPALIGQSLMAAPVIKVVGFSHGAIRLLTLLLACLLLWTLDALLQLGSVRPSVRLAALLTVGLNPLFFYLSATFMTEIYGYSLALLGAVLWFLSRRARDDANQAVSYGVSMAVGALLGWTFWTRQFSAVLFPSLVAATALQLWVRGKRAQLKASLGTLGAGLAVWLVMIVLYLLWAKWTGNYKPEFSTPLGKLLIPEARAWRLQVPIFIVYLGVFLAPLSLLVPWRRGHWGSLLGVAVALAFVVILSKWSMQTAGDSDFAMRAWFRKSFPYLHNVAFNAGLGPITFPETHFFNVDVVPRWTAEKWGMLEKVLLLLPLSLAPMLVGLRRFWRERRGHPSVELLLFGAFTAFSSLAVTIQAYRCKVFDRYHFPALLGFVLSAAVLVEFALQPRMARPGRMVRSALAAVVWAALGFFSVAGLQDHFRWNDARWQLVNEAIASGASPLNIAGGYEVDGWLLYDAKKDQRQPPNCIGACRCLPGVDWYCVDDSLRVGMGVFPGYQPVKAIQPDYWLANGPPVILSQRRGPKR